MRPECLVADQTRRRRTPSRRHERLARAPLSGRGYPSLTVPRNAGISSPQISPLPSCLRRSEATFRPLPLHEGASASRRQVWESYEGRFGDLVEQHAGGIKATLPF